MSFLSQSSKKQLKHFLSFLKGRKARKVKGKDLEVSGRPAGEWASCQPGGQADELGKQARWGAGFPGLRLSDSW